MTNQNKSYMYAALSVLCWSTVATVFKLGLQSVNNIQLLLISSFISLITLLILLYLNGKFKYIKELNRWDYLRYMITGLLNPFAYYLVLFKAYELLPAQEALTLNYTWAIVVPIFSIFFLKQKVRLLSISALFISLIGVIIIVTKGDVSELKFINMFGTLLAAGSSLIWASYWILNLKDKNDELIKLFFSFLFGFTYILITNIIIGYPIFNLSINSYLACIYIGLFEMGLTFYFWLKALSLSKNTAKVSSIIFLSPFISLNLISYVLGEKILISTIIGLIFIIIGIISQKLIK